MQSLFEFLLQLVKEKYTGKIILNFQHGNFKKGTKRKRVMGIEVEDEQEFKI